MLFAISTFFARLGQLDTRLTQQEIAFAHLAERINQVIDAVKLTQPDQAERTRILSELTNRLNIVDLRIQGLLQRSDPSQRQRPQGELSQ